jgi:hypothetical protein
MMSAQNDEASILAPTGQLRMHFSNLPVFSRVTPEV